MDGRPVVRTTKPLPSGVPRLMCFCGDPCKVDISEDEKTYKQRYWMCSNFAWEPTPQQRIKFIVRKFYCALRSLCHMKHDFFNNDFCCRPLHRCVILSSGLTLRSKSQTSGF